MKIKTMRHPKVKRWQRIIAGQNSDPDFFLSNHFRIITTALKFGLVEELVLTEGTPAEELFPGEERILITEEVRNELKLYSNHFALIRKTKKEISEWKRILLIDSCDEDGVLGTLIRTSRCFGFDGILLTNSKANPWGMRTVRAAQESAFIIPIEKMSLPEALRTLKEKGCSMVTVGNRKAVPVEELPPFEQMAVVVSGDRSTSFDLMAESDITCRMDFECIDPNILSANASILMYAYRNLKGDGLC
jgi:tRNA G18 (ribose-2'-O)-methylase SpoU